MEEVILKIVLLGIIGLVVVVFLINDKLKTLQYRLEQQIEQNEEIIKLLSTKEE